MINLHFKKYVFDCNKRQRNSKIHSFDKLKHLKEIIIQIVNIYLESNFENISKNASFHPRNNRQNSQKAIKGTKNDNQIVFFTGEFKKEHYTFVKNLDSFYSNCRIQIR